MKKMKSMIRVEQYQGKAMDPAAVWHLTPMPERPVLTVGRATTCSFVLADPERVVSREHAHIAQHQNTWTWTDTGTNPSFLNGTALLAGTANPLVCGDTLRVGAYQLRFEQSPAATPSGELAATPSQLPENWDQLLGIETHKAPQDFFAIPEPDPQTMDDLLACDSVPCEFCTPPDTDHAHTHACSQALAQGLGVSFQQDFTLEQFERVGHLLRICMQGSYKLMQARDVFRQEIGSPVASIAVSNNNPVQFSASPQQALEKLLQAPRKGYMPADQAMEQLFFSLNEHMRSTVVAMQNTLGHLLMQLDPGQIESQEDQNRGVAKRLLAGRHTRLWHIYGEQFKALGGNADDPLQHALGQVFRRAYEGKQ